MNADDIPFANFTENSIAKNRLFISFAHKVQDRIHSVPEMKSKIELDVRKSDDDDDGDKMIYVKEKERRGSDCWANY